MNIERTYHFNILPNLSKVLCAIYLKLPFLCILHVVSSAVSCRISKHVCFPSHCRFTLSLVEAFLVPLHTGHEYQALSSVRDSEFYGWLNIVYK